MGMRLTGRPVRHSKGFDIPSDGIAPGAIQVPGNGQPIVLLADRQTTGGYPKIATVISADLPALSRLPIGARVALRGGHRRGSRSGAARASRDARGAQGQDRIVDEMVTDIAPRLHACNLISGIVDAAA